MHENTSIAKRITKHYISKEYGDQIADNIQAPANTNNLNLNLGDEEGGDNENQYLFKILLRVAMIYFLFRQYLKGILHFLFICGLVLYLL